jgi:hypothetical protein
VPHPSTSTEHLRPQPPLQTAQLAAPRCNPPRAPLHTEQVRTARAADIRVVLVHECDPALGGCEFSRFFQTTPQDLIADGLYARVAVAFHTGLHRTVSLCLLARELGAVRYGNRINWALNSRGHAAVDVASLHPGTALVLSRNSSDTSSRAAPLVEAEHLDRTSSCLDSPFPDPPGNEGSEPEGEGRSKSLSLARGQLVASGPDPNLTLQSVVHGQDASSEGKAQSPARAEGAEQQMTLPGALDSTNDEQGEATAEAKEEVAEEGNQHDVDDASMGATREALNDRARAALKIQSFVRGKAGRADITRATNDARHPSIRRVRQRHIATLALQAPSWHDQELRANAEGATRANFNLHLPPFGAEADDSSGADQDGLTRAGPTAAEMRV